MIRKTTLAIAAATLISLASFSSSASAAPVNLSGLGKATADTELVQVRGGRGGGFRGGFRGGRHFGGGHFRRHFRHHGHHHKWKWKRRHIHIGSYGGYAGGCGYYWNRWQATGFYHWKAKYYACIGY